MTQRSAAVTAEAVRIRLLGPPAIERRGDPVSVDTRKAIALLAYLVVTGRPQSRDHLATLLWPSADQSRARSALRRTLSALNTALEGRGLRVARESLAIDRDDLTVDLSDFRALASSDDTASLRSAADLYFGDFLAGLVLRDSPEFDEWQLAVAEDIRREAGAVLERLANSASDPDEAVGYARRWLELDRLHEPAHRLLMTLYTRRGDRAAALRQYRECVAVLERDLGVEPLEETTELYESIREDRAPTPAAPATTPRDAAAELPFIGRDDELRTLREVLRSATSDGRLIVIGGEAGIGKTRLAEEFIAEAKATGAPLLSARCHAEESGMAFGVAIELLQDLPASRLATASPRSLTEAARLVPELAPTAGPSPHLDSPAARRRLFESVADVLASAAADTPAIAFIDDAHWMDESSRDVLRFLVHRLSGRRLCVVVTWRTEEVPPAHPLRRMYTDAARDGIATGITLQRLTPSDVEELVRRTGAGDETARTLFEETAGVPFFVSEYLKSADRETLPGGIRDLLESRVESVTRRAAQILAAAAVLGRGFDPLIVRETSGRSPDEVTAALDELSDAGLVAESDDRYDFTHPKLREYVYESTTLGRRRLLHGRAAQAIARRARRRPELAAVAAHHYERAGEEDQAAEFFRQAGEHAAGVYANAEALAHLRSALALGHGDAAVLHEAIGDLQTLIGTYDEAIASYEKAIALGADVGRAARRLGGVRHRLGDWDIADAHYAEAEDVLADPSERARVLADRSLNAHRANRDVEAQDLAARALAEAERADDERSLVQAHNVAGIMASHRRDLSEARRHLEASLAGAERLGDPAAIAAALNNLALALRAAGEAGAALQHAERALDLCGRIGDRHREAAVHSNIADVLRDLGRSDEAMGHLKKSAAIFADVGAPDEPHPEIWKLVEW